MRLIGLILRIYSYCFEFLLSVLLLIFGILDASIGHTMELGMLPWTGAHLTHWLTGLGLAGVVCTLLAVTGWFRYLFPIWALAILVLAFRGFFVSPFQFSGRAGFHEALWFTFGCLLAFLGSLTVFQPRVEAPKRYRNV